MEIVGAVQGRLRFLEEKDLADAPSRQSSLRLCFMHGSINRGRLTVIEGDHTVFPIRKLGLWGAEGLLEAKRSLADGEVRRI